MACLDNNGHNLWLSLPCLQLLSWKESHWEARKEITLTNPASVTSLNPVWVSMMLASVVTMKRPLSGRTTASFVSIGQMFTESSGRTAPAKRTSSSAGTPARKQNVAYLHRISHFAFS